MGGLLNKDERAGPMVPLPVVYAVAGLLIGFAAVHPATMLMNHHMTGALHHPDGWMAAGADALLGAFTTVRGWVWGSGYALLFALIGYLMGALKSRELDLRVANAELASEKERSDKLLLNVLPRKVADELKESGQSPPQKFDDVTILFSDLVGFSRIAAQMTPELLIRELNELFTAFDNIMEENGCERVKTIGDAYLAVCGMPETHPDHATNVVRAALGMIGYLKARKLTASVDWEIRIGVHTGPVVGGVVGIKKYIYDVFGDTINCAASLQQHCDPMRLNVSEATLARVGNGFAHVARGDVKTKEGRSLRMHYLEAGAEAAKQP